MPFVIIVSSRHADLDIFGPYPSEDDAERAMKDARDALWDLAGEDGSVEVNPLRAPGTWNGGARR